MHPVAGSVVDPQFRNAFAYGPDVSRVSGCQSLDPSQDAGPAARVPQAVKPRGVNLRLADLDHAWNVARRLQAINSRPPFRDAGCLVVPFVHPLGTGSRLSPVGGLRRRDRSPGAHCRNCRNNSDVQHAPIASAPMVTVLRHHRPSAVFAPTESPAVTASTPQGALHARRPTFTLTRISQVNFGVECF